MLTVLTLMAVISVHVTLAFLVMVSTVYVRYNSQLSILTSHRLQSPLSSTYMYTLLPSLQMIQTVRLLDRVTRILIAFTSMENTDVYVSRVSMVTVLLYVTVRFSFIIYHYNSTCSSSC